MLFLRVTDTGICSIFVQVTAAGVPTVAHVVVQRLGVVHTTLVFMTVFGNERVKRNNYS